MAFLQTIPELRRPAPGVELLCLPEPRFKRAQLGLSLDLPLDDGRAARTLLSEVLQQGSAAHPTRRDLSRALQEAYGANCSLYADRNGENHRIGISLGWVGERFLPPGNIVVPQLLEMVRQTLEEPRRGKDGQPFDEEVVERERKLLMQRLAERKDDRPGYAEERFISLMCEGEPYGLQAWDSEQAVAALTADDLEQARMELLATAKITAVVVGPCDPDIIAAWLADVFGGRSKLATLPEIGRPVPAAIREVREQLPMDQAQFHYGFRYPEPADKRAFEALGFACSVLGGGSHGRLFRIVREQKSLAYGIYAMQRARKGLITVAAGIDASAYQEVRDEVDKQLAELQQNGPTAEEMEMTLVNRLDRLRGLADSGYELATYFVREHTLGLERSPAERAAILQDLKPTEIAEAARLLVPDMVYLLEPNADASAVQPEGIPAQA
ncbi:MAG: pitrilysin family protein [Planctomycetota bacterium]|jgi:predicted Zn-dependent peptidase|nr:pitrilysin family protein [Planctomycetota bacterium]